LGQVLTRRDRRHHACTFDCGRISLADDACLHPDRRAVLAHFAESVEKHEPGSGARGSGVPHRRVWISMVADRRRPANHTSGATSSDAARPRCGRFRLIRLDGHEASRNLFVRSEAMRRESARFQAVFVASSWFRQNGVLSSRPPVPCRGITPAVRRLNHRSNIDHNY